jgi:hypothetical protein
MFFASLLSCCWMPDTEIFLLQAVLELCEILKNRQIHDELSEWLKHLLPGELFQGSLRHLTFDPNVCKE